MATLVTKLERVGQRGVQRPRPQAALGKQPHPLDRFGRGGHGLGVLIFQMAQPGEQREGDRRHLPSWYNLDRSLLERLGGAVEIIEQHPRLTEPEPRQPTAQRCGREVDRPQSQLFRLRGVAGVLPEVVANAKVQAQQTVRKR